MGNTKTLGDTGDREVTLVDLLKTAADAKRRISDLNASIAVEVSKLKELQKSSEAAIANLLAESGGNKFSAKGVGSVTVSHSDKYSIADVGKYLKAAELIPELYRAIGVTLKPAVVTQACSAAGIDVAMLVESGAMKEYSARRVTVTPAKI